MLEIYKPLSQRDLSQQKIEEYTKYCKIVQYGRQNPIWFIEEFLGIKLMDYQKWCLMNSWWRPYALWLCCRTTGKTSLAAVMLMAKMLLFPNYRVYISTNAAPQSIEVFKKVEEIALQNNPSFASCTDIFAREVDISRNSETGFIHDPMGHRVKVFNNSELITLSSNETSIRGKRGSVLYDETAWQTKEQMAATEHFTDQDSSFQLSTSHTQYNDPKNIPLQLLYASSAGDKDFPFYTRYKEFARQMFMGNEDYFVCDLNCDTVMYHTTVDGEPFKSQLTEASIKKSIEEDPDSADRELFNKFRTGGGQNSVVKMETLLRNSVVRPPLLNNNTGQKKFILCYDPARNYDGSILSVFQIINDEKVGYRLKTENVISMVDKETKGKTPLPMNEQLQIIKQTMINYNGDRSAEWENIEFYIDSGAGGGGISAVADQLLEDWKDDEGIVHRGIIDPTHKQYETARRKYPNAAPIVHLIDPQAYKKIIYNAAEKLIRDNLIEFTLYDNKDYINIENANGDFDKYLLNDEERLSLVEINLMKHEMSYMCRYETGNGNVQYELSKDKKHNTHDDRAYTLAMAAYALSTKRRNDIIKTKKQTTNTPMFLQVRKPQIKRR